MCKQAAYRWKQRRWWWSTKTGLFFYAPPILLHVLQAWNLPKKGSKMLQNVRSTLRPKVSLFRKHNSSPLSFVESLSLVVYNNQCSFSLPTVSLPFSRIEKQVGVSARVCTVISSSSSKNQTSESSPFLLVVEKIFFEPPGVYVRRYVPWRVSVGVVLGASERTLTLAVLEGGEGSRAQRCTQVSGS